MSYQRACLFAPSFGEQTEMGAQAMNALPVRQLDLAVQQAAALETVCRNIPVLALHDGEAAEDCVAVVSGLVYRILAIGTMRPHRTGDEFVLCLVGIVVVTLGMVAVFALHFLQEYDVGIQLAQSFAQPVHHDAAIEVREALVDVVGGDGQRAHVSRILAERRGGRKRKKTGETEVSPVHYFISFCVMGIG